MSTDMLAAQPRWMGISGWVIVGICAVFLLLDAGMKLARLPIVLQTNAALGWPAASAQTLGIVLLACTLLYLVPRTSVIGAILLSAYLGGAVATHARIDSPLFTHTLFGVYIGILVWAGLVLRSPALRALLMSR
jgi:hypothetical protein